MNVYLYNVLIERDTMTTVVLTAPAHEVDILREVHGFERVSVSDEPVGEYTLLDDELERLTRKYGFDAQGRSIVSHVYPNVTAFANAVKENEVVDEQVEVVDKPKRGRKKAEAGEEAKEIEV